MVPPSHRPHYLTERERFLLWLRAMTLSEDGVAEVCLNGNTACASLMLRVILERDDLTAERVAAQKSLPNLYGHGVRFDILALDGEGRLYDIEIQVGGTVEELALRARMYSSFLDMHQLKKGEDYKLLREHWVIFIVDRDMFGLGEPLYRIERCVLGGCKDGGELLFGDNAHILFANSKIRDTGTRLSWLMHDLNCPDPEKMHYRELADVLRHYKTNKKGVRKMRSAVFAKLEKDIGADYFERGMALGKEQGMALGKEQGIEESRRAIARRLLEVGLSCELVVQSTDLSLEEVLALAGKQSGGA